MELTFAYWFLFPVSILIATIATSTGIGGAIFFSPLFIIVLRMDPSVAFGTALTTQLFGFGSGLYAYARQRLIDYKLGVGILKFSIPAAVVGSLSAGAFPALALKIFFAAGIIFIGSRLYTSYHQEKRERLDKGNNRKPEISYESTLTTRDGVTYKYTVSEKKLGRFFAAIGGAFLGMISVGLAELQEYHLVARCRVPLPVAVATSIFAVVVTVLIASLGHFYNTFTGTESSLFQQIVAVLTFTIPGVIVGGQIGPLVQARVNPDLMKLAISFLFISVGVFMLATVLV